VDLSLFKPRSKDEMLLKKLGIENQCIAGYIGTIGMAHGLETVIEAAEIIQNTPNPENHNIKILILGDGARKEPLKKLAKDKKLENLIFIDTVSKAEVADYWSLLDISIIHLKKDPLFEKVIPSKLFECMAMGIPVLHGVLGESAEIVSRLGVGKTITPDNSQVLAQELLNLSKNTKELTQMKEAAIDAANQFDRKHLAKSMLASITKVIKT
jgi:glycosyltransferase involved in cell wall biosynthesis